MLEYNLDLTSESYQHFLTVDNMKLSFPFSLVEIGYFCAREGYFTKRDGLKYYLLLVTVEGSGRITWKGQKSTLEPGQAVLIDCMEYHEYATVAGGNWTFYYVHFVASSMEGYGHFLLQNLSVVHLRDVDAMCRLMKDMVQSASEMSALASALQSNMISSVLTEMTYSQEKDTYEKPSNYRIQKVADFIRENCEEDLHLEDFMAVAHLSKYHLIRTFEKHIGMSPYRYMHLCRINRSLNLLKSADLSIAQVASMVGYSDAVTYIRQFKTFHKISPGKYRLSSVMMQEQEPTQGQG